MSEITKKQLKEDLTKLLHEAFEAGVQGLEEPELAVFDTVVDIFVNQAEKTVKEELQNAEPPAPNQE